jgi:methylenetetrahydrofolate reductase (NADPH)
LRDYLTALGVTVPVVPGIISILSASQIRKFAALCGASLPPALQVELDKRAHNDAAAAEFGIEYATGQCQELLEAGVPGLHFYTLNKAHAMTRILQNLAQV